MPKDEMPIEQQPVMSPSLPAPSAGGSNRRLRLWLLCGVGVAAAMTLLAVLVAVFVTGANPTAPPPVFNPKDSPWWWSRMACYLGAAIVFILGMLALPKVLPAAWGHRRLIVVMILFAVAMRAPLFFIPGKNGFDYNNYLWNGAMTAHLQSPYQYSYNQIRLEGKGNQAVRDLVEEKGSSALAPVAYTGKEILARANHPNGPPGYPPVAEGLFGLGHLLTPFNLTGWRLILLALDLLTAVLTLSLIRGAGMPLAAWSAYLWNPLLLFETYVDGHVEIAAVALVVLAVWLLSRRYFIAFGAVVAQAMAVKLWPAYFLVYLVRPAWRHKWKVLLALVVFGILGAELMVPYLIAIHGTTSVAWYVGSSHDNQGLHYLLDQANESVVQWLGLHEKSDRLARMAGYALWLIVLAWSVLRRWDNAYQLCFRVGVALLFFWLQQATIYPWYYQAVIPFAAVTLRPSLLAWTLLLPLTQLPLADPVFEDWYNWNYLMLIVHAPVGLLLVLELFNWPRRPAQAKASAPAPAGPA